MLLRYCSVKMTLSQALQGTCCAQLICRTAVVAWAKVTNSTLPVFAPGDVVIQRRCTARDGCMPAPTAVDGWILQLYQPAFSSFAIYVHILVRYVHILPCMPTLFVFTSSLEGVQSTRSFRIMHTAQLLSASIRACPLTLPNASPSSTVMLLAPLASVGFWWHGCSSI